MGKRILLVWEAGGGQGHLLHLDWVGAALRRRGYETAYALRRLPPENAAGCDIRQAPAWPGSTDPAYRLPRRPTCHIDVLAELGMAGEGVFQSILSSWDRLFSEIKPDAIVADAAPAGLTAARGRIPTIAVGNGFTLPPATLERFPALDSDNTPSQTDEEKLLSAINEALRATSRRSLEHLPQLYAADRVSVGTFVELDPYNSLREIPVTAPPVPHWDHESPMEREEIFAYFSIKTKARHSALEALTLTASAGLRVRVHAPNLEAETVKWLTASGVRFEPQPVPLTDVRSRARLLVSVGSLGFVSFGAAVGIPHIVLPWSIVTRWTGDALQRIGIGRTIELGGDNPLEPALLRQFLRESFSDPKETERAKALAPDFTRRLTPRSEEIVPGLVDELL